MAMCARDKGPIVMTSLGARPDGHPALYAWCGKVLHDIIDDTHAHRAIETGAGVHGKRLEPPHPRTGVDAQHLPEGPVGGLKFGHEYGCKHNAWKRIGGRGHGTGALGPVLPVALRVVRLRAEHDSTRRGPC